MIKDEIRWKLFDQRWDPMRIRSKWPPTSLITAPCQISGEKMIIKVRWWSDDDQTRIGFKSYKDQKQVTRPTSLITSPCVGRQESRQIQILSSQDHLEWGWCFAWWWWFKWRYNNFCFRSAGKRDIGSYSCVLENQLGAGKSARSAYLDVHYPPQVLYPNILYPEV